MQALFFIYLFFNFPTTLHLVIRLLVFPSLSSFFFFFSCSLCKYFWIWLAMFLMRKPFRVFLTHCLSFTLFATTTIDWKSFLHLKHASFLQNENRTLWKLGTLPPGLITFYSTTKPLDKSWHVLGLGYNPSIDADEIKNAAVVHFNGNNKPWLDIAMMQYRPLWSKYVDYENEFIQSCNFAV